MLNNGTLITIPILTRLFKKMFRVINGLTAIELHSLTSGQFQRDGLHAEAAGTYRSDVMNVWSTQYFDSIYVEGEVYFKYYQDVIDYVEG